MDCHDTKHQFFRFDHPQSSGIPCSCRLACGRATAKGIFAGAKVVRGPDWDWGDQDGGDGQQGKVQVRYFLFECDYIGFITYHIPDELVLNSHVSKQNCVIHRKSEGGRMKLIAQWQT